MELTKEEVQHIANLARLQLTDEELETYGRQLSRILDYIDQLKEADTENVEPTAQVAGLINVAREDKIRDWDRSEAEEALKQAPDIKGGQIKVKRVLYS